MVRPGPGRGVSRTAGQASNSMAINRKQPMAVPLPAANAPTPRVNRMIVKMPPPSGSVFGKVPGCPGPGANADQVRPVDDHLPEQMCNRSC